MTESSEARWQIERSGPFDSYVMATAPDGEKFDKDYGDDFERLVHRVEAAETDLAAALRRLTNSINRHNAEKTALESRLTRAQVLTDLADWWAATLRAEKGDGDLELLPDEEEYLRRHSAAKEEREDHQLERQRLAITLAQQGNEVEQILGQALGYPWYKDDLKNFPNATEADGVCVGDHVPESLAAEIAAQLSAATKRAALADEVFGRGQYRWVCPQCGGNLIKGGEYWYCEKARVGTPEWVAHFDASKRAREKPAEAWIVLQAAYDALPASGEEEKQG